MNGRANIAAVIGNEIGNSEVMVTIDLPLQQWVTRCSSPQAVWWMLF